MPNLPETMNQDIARKLLNVGEAFKIPGPFFSYEEINALIEGVLFSRTLDTRTAHHLIEKIEEHLTTRFYKKGAKRICTVR